MSSSRRYESFLRNDQKTLPDEPGEVSIGNKVSAPGFFHQTPWKTSLTHSQMLKQQTLRALSLQMVMSARSDLLSNCFGSLIRGSPMHFSLAAQIEGHTSVGDWRIALGQVQRRHPFFSVCIDKTGDRGPHFRQVPDMPIQIRFVRPEASQPNWLSEMERELATPFDPQRAPLVRAVPMHEPHRTTFILTAHHSIADGLSLTFAIRDTLLALSGVPLDPLLITPSMESMLDSAADRPIESNTTEIEGMKPSVFRPQHGSIPSIRGLRISSELTAKAPKAGTARTNNGARRPLCGPRARRQTRVH
jgi:hypothetical protein